MRHGVFNALTAMAVLATHVVLAQPMKPTVPGTLSDPVWQGILRHSDGRTFVTDGGLAIDAALAKPAKLPDRELPAKLLQDYFSAPHQHEFGFSDLTAAASGKTYTAPQGLALNATYINFLRRILPAGVVRFHASGGRQPIVIHVNGTPVGVLMPVQQ